MNHGKVFLVGAASCLLMGAVAIAQTVPGTGSASAQASAGQMSANDKKFLEKAAQGGMAEVEFGKLAESNAQSQDVKDFGKRMVDDHSKANDELKHIASQTGATLPSGLSAADNTTKEHLSSMKGDAFDKAYMRHMVVDHETDVNEFKQEARGGKDPQLKDWASKTLPTLEQHLQIAQQVDAKVKTEGTSTGPKQ
jgi:putative membrane protein